MLFIIVMLATYIWRGANGPWLTPFIEHLGVVFGPNTACLIHRVTRCRAYRGACVGFSNPTFWQRSLSSLEWDQITQSAWILRFRGRRYKYPPGRPGCNPRDDRAKKINNPICAWWLYIITRVQNYRAWHDEYLLNLDQVAGCYNQAIYVVIFH